VLSEEGYAYSSSVAPDRARSLWLARSPALRISARPRLGSDRASSHHGRSRRTPHGGGWRAGFFRLLPYAFSSWAIGRVNSADARPAVFYFHPWEIDPGQPRVANAPLKSRLRHYSNLSAMEPKLLKLLKSHRWGRTDEVVLAERARLQ
jgi:hypothetical protein